MADKLFPKPPSTRRFFYNDVTNKSFFLIFEIVQVGKADYPCTIGCNREFFSQLCEMPYLIDGKGVSASWIHQVQLMLIWHKLANIFVISLDSFPEVH